MFVYLIKEENTEKYKIGVSARPEQRIKHLQTASSERLELREKFKTKYSYKMERLLHRTLSTYRVIGEWYKLSLEQERSFQSICSRAEKNFELLSRENTYVNKYNLL